MKRKTITRPDTFTVTLTTAQMTLIEIMANRFMGQIDISDDTAMALINQNLIPLVDITTPVKLYEELEEITIKCSTGINWS